MDLNEIGKNVVVHIVAKYLVYVKTSIHGGQVIKYVSVNYMFSALSKHKLLVYLDWFEKNSTFLYPDVWYK